MSRKYILSNPKYQNSYFGKAKYRLRLYSDYSLLVLLCFILFFTSFFKYYFIPLTLEIKLEFSGAYLKKKNIRDRGREFDRIDRTVA